MEKPHFCVDCKFFSNTEPPTCLHVEAKRWDVVMGQEIQSHACHAMRAGICGQAARLFKEKS